MDRRWGSSSGATGDDAESFRDETQPEADTNYRRIAYTPETPDEPPRVPAEPPSSGRERSAIVKNTVRWLVRAATSRTPVGRAVWGMIDAAEWAKPYVKSYFDPPKRLEELQRAASEPKVGHDKHHLVERTSALNAGFPSSQVDGPENIVRIPTLKHWEINRWFETVQDKYGGLTPRQYLRNPAIKWEERVTVGRDALVTFGVLEQ
jgi:hypothetical protein